MMSLMNPSSRRAGARRGAASSMRRRTSAPERPPAAVAASPCPCSETRQIRMRQFAARNMQSAVLGAAVERGDGLARIEQTVRVERRLDAEEGVQRRAIELLAHLVDLLHADAMLAGDRAAERDRQLQDVGAEFL